MANAANTTRTNNAAQVEAFFDLHTTGIGYLSRIRIVSPTKRSKDNYVACTINALHGSKEDVHYTKFDVRISGTEAEARILALKGYVDANRKVLVQFKIGDIYPEAFVFQKGTRAGQTGVVNKGRLLQVNAAKVDGTVYNFINVEAAAEDEPFDDEQDGAVPSAGIHVEEIDPEEVTDWPKLDAA